MLYRFLFWVACAVSASCTTAYIQYQGEELSGGVVDPEQVCVVYQQYNGALAPKEIQIANWNILKGQRTGWHEEISQLSGGNTLFTIQEAPHHSALHDSLGEHHQWHFSPGYHTGDIQTGVLTSVNVGSTMSCRLQHVEPWLKTPKASLITRYPIEGSDQQLLVANIHSVNFSLGTKHFTKQLHDVVDLLRQYKGPIIFAGDFNTWNERRMTILSRYTTLLGLKEVPYNVKDVKQFRGLALDHIFYRQLELLDRSIKHVDSSDHNMLLATFSI